MNRGSQVEGARFQGSAAARREMRGAARRTESAAGDMEVRSGMTRGRPPTSHGWVFLCLLVGSAAPVGCAGHREPVEPVIVPNPTLGRVTIAVAPALNLSGSTDFDPNRFADLMAGELTYAERVSVIPVSRVLGVLAAQGADRVGSPAQAREIASRVGADAILVFAVTEYDPYDPPRVGISAQLYAATPATDHPAAGDSASGGASTRLLAETQRRFDAAHADINDEIRSFARQRSADGSAYGWRKYIVSQQHFIQYCCSATIRALLNGQGGPVVVGNDHER